ncbi:MAG: sulfur carrier protein ThiS [Sedimentisphaerales bacterium]|nr:sulfur carrier protein ThiS [Sedimentisphaerales bacterium]
MGSLQINGEARHFSPDEMPATLAGLVEKLGLVAATVVAEVDGRIVRPGEFSRTAISDGQSIELVKFMGGG